MRGDGPAGGTMYTCPITADGMIDVNPLMNADTPDKNAKRNLKMLVKTTHRLRPRASTDVKVNVFSWLDELISTPSCSGILRQLLIAIGAALETRFFYQLQAGKKTKQDQPVVVKVLTWTEALSTSTMDQRLAEYVYACAEKCIRFQFFHYMQDKASPARLSVANGAFVFEDNTLAVCCPNVRD